MREHAVLKKVVCLLLLLHIAIVIAEECSNDGDIRIIGTNTRYLIAGRLEICAEGSWRAVYDDNWGTREAIIVCTGREFPKEGAIACRDSCFGYSSLEQGYTDFDSCNDEETLLACGEIADDGHFPDMNAGVICFRSRENRIRPLLTTCNPNTTSPTSSLTMPTSCLGINCSTCICSTSSCPEVPLPTCDTPTTSSVMDATTVDSSGSKNIREGQTNSTGAETCTAITIFLGILSAFLLLILMGVSIGWAWSCHKMKGKKHMVVDPDAPVVNPSYNSVLPSKYSALGPRNTPTTHAPIPTVPLRLGGEGELPYEVPIQSQRPQRNEVAESDYEVPREKRGMDYEVPTSTADEKNYASIPMKNRPDFRECN